MTTSTVRHVIEQATQSYEECWELLASMKKGNLPQPTNFSIADFQPKLANAISELSKVYRMLASKKNCYIGKKDNLSKDWFIRRMRLLDNHQEIITQTILVGRSIGDAFAWFFYQNNRDYLAEHLKEPEQLLSPSGVGGYAELEVVRNVPVTQGDFVLYHGITSILRLGDFSLINLKSLSVTTVGEIKAGKPSEGKLEVALIFPLKAKQPATTLLKTYPSKLSNLTNGPISGLSTKARDRLNRQLDRMTASHDKIQLNPDKKLSLQVDNKMAHFDKFLASLRTNGFKYLKLGNGLLLAGIQVPNKSLYTRLIAHPTLKLTERMDGLEQHAVSLMASHRNDNALIIGSWFYRKGEKLSHKPGMTHPLWWPISAEAMKRVIFQEVLIFTVFNPVHLFELLEEAGFTVTADFPENYSAEKRTGDAKLSLEGIPHYLELIQHYFFSEQDIVSLVRQVEENMVSPSKIPYSEIELSIHQNFGQRPE